MVGYTLSLIIVTLLPLGLIFGIIDRLRGRPWVMRPTFCREWYERHVGVDPPVGACEHWLAEWRETRITAGRWLDREYP